MLSKGDLQKLAGMRLEDAIVLLRNNRPSSAYYLSGYSVELAIKACIASLYQADSIPEKAFVNATYTHNLNSLISTAGLSQELKADTRRNPDLAANWAIATKWNEQSRYQFWDIIAAATIINSISDNKNGVFQWVRNRW